MNKNRKRILCCVLSFLMLFSLLPLSAFAEEQPDASLTGADGALIEVSTPPAEETSPEANTLPVEQPQPEEEPQPEENTPPEEQPQPEENTLPEEEPQPEENTPPEEQPSPEEGTPSDDPGADDPADAPVDEQPAEDANSTDGALEDEESAEESPAEASEQLQLVWQLLAALPSADEIAAMNEEELSYVDELITRILESYDLLSEEEQALVDLSPLEAFTAALDAQPLAAADELSYTVSYSRPPDAYEYNQRFGMEIPVFNSGDEITFTMKGSGGSGSYQYYYGSVLVYVDGGFPYDSWRKNSMYMDDPNFNFDFAASGLYWIRADIRDAQTNQYTPGKIVVRINDPSRPSVEEVADDVVRQCNEQGYTTQYEKALFYHDWIINHAEYDYESDKLGANGRYYAGACGIFCRGISNCQGYHDALVMLLRRSGIECEDVTGNGHIWTRVKLDGVWTLIDATWDDTVLGDPSDPTAEYRSHMYFGITDELMKVAHSDHASNPDHPCDSFAKNYMILTTDESKSIRKMSDPIKDQIIALHPGTHPIDAKPGSFNISSAYYKNLCPIAAYYLENCDPDLKDTGITVTYNSADHTYTVFKPCTSHTPQAIPGKAATCTQTGLTAGEKCSVCGTVTVQQQTIPLKAHTLKTLPAVAATCTKTGLTEGKQCTVCQTVTVAQKTVPTVAHKPVKLPAVAPNGFTPGKTEGQKCSVCGKVLKAQQEYYSNTALFLPADGLAGSTLWVDGLQLDASAVTQDGKGNICIELGRTDATNLVTYTYNKSSANPHEVYPVGMKVWMLSYSNGRYTATHIPEFDDLLKYAGSSIRISGNKGIRMITGIRQDVKNALTGGGLAGYTLREYGTVLGLASNVSASSLVLGASGAKSNYAYKRGVADPVFASGGGMIQYTNVLVGFNNDQCKQDIVMRPYIVLRSADGRDVTVYGGVVQRSIGYIATQNRTVFAPGSAAYNYVWDIIHYVYGNKFDK